MMRHDVLEKGSAITKEGMGLKVPAKPIVPYIEGDGVGPDIWAAARPVWDAAVKKAYGGEREIQWLEVFAGEKAHTKMKQWLPKETLDMIRDYKVAIKGPLTTPVGGGIRSLNVTIRQELDLYACVRPVRYFQGVPSPVKHPEHVDMVIFRENTEDVYAGIEWKEGSKEALKVIKFLNEEMGCRVREDSGIGVKPMSVTGSKRLIRMALRYALRHHRETVTLVHKGNIMKYTEGAFREWGYEVARNEFSGKVVGWEEIEAQHGGKKPAGAVLINDVIADAMFQQVLLRPSDYSVLALPNLNGDYMSDALLAQVGGLGIGPGANIGDHEAVFEATHGTAPKYAGLDKINPSSLILSGVMMLEHMGWDEAAKLVVKGMQKNFLQKRVTYDFERQMEGAKLLKCSEFGQAIIQNME